MDYKKYKIIDSHCHIFPDKIAQKATDSIDNFYGIGESEDIEVCGFVGNAKTLLTQCDAVGVDRCLVTSVATTPPHAQSINAFIAREVELFPDRFIGFGSLHPESETLEEDAVHLIELGLKGVKLHPDIQNFKVDNPKVIKIFEICNEKKLPVLVHTGDSRYDNSNPNRVKKILEMFPDLTVIGAHFGGWSLWDEAPRELSKYKNRVTRISCTHSATVVHSIEKVSKALGAPCQVTAALARYSPIKTASHRRLLAHGRSL